MNWHGGWWLDCAPRVLAVQSSGGSGAAGKYYFEMTATHAYSSGFQVDSGWTGFGICNSSAALTSGTWSSGTSQAAEANTSGVATIGNPAGTGTGAGRGVGFPTRTTGLSTLALATLACAIDTVNKRVWYKNITTGGNWAGDGTINENPNTGVGGFNFASAVPGNLHVWAGATQRNNNNFGAGTINFGATAFVGALPTGYSAWGATDFLNPNDNSVLVLSGGNLSFSSVGNGELLNVGKLVRSFGRKAQA